MNLIQKVRLGIHIIDSILWLNERRWPVFVFVEEQRTEIRALGLGVDVIVVSKDEIEDVQKILSNPLTDESKRLLAAMVDRRS